MKTAIVYYSRHHENTKQLLTAIRKAYPNEVSLFDITENPSVDLSSYDRIGFASGIYYSKFDKHLLEFAQKNMPHGKDVFLVYTYGVKKEGYTKAIREALAGTDSRILGEYGCLGFNTFGPFKLIGGIAKNHPDNTDLRNAVSFYQGLRR